MTGAGFATRTCTKATRSRSAAQCAPSSRATAIASRRPRSTSRTTSGTARTRVAGCSKDEASIQWLQESYRTAARDFTRFQIQNSRAVFGRDIHHVMLLHLGAFSAHILPDLFRILEEEGFEIVTLEEAQKDPAYDYDPDFADARGGTLVELGMQAKKIPWPANAPKLPRERLTTICK